MIEAAGEVFCAGWLIDDMWCRCEVVGVVGGGKQVEVWKDIYHRKKLGSTVRK